jgi:hypothetical protein
MPFSARKPACRRPTTVAVHDDRDVSRRGDILDLNAQRLLFGHSTAQSLKP